MPLLRKVLPFAIAAMLVTGARAAGASNCSNPFVSTCINADSYWPHAGPMRFAAVGSTETVAPGQVGFGVVGTWLSQPIKLHVASPGNPGSEANVVDDLVDANFAFAYGVSNRLQLDFTLPVTFVQSGSGTSALTGGEALHDTAIRDLRFGFAYALIPRSRTGHELDSNTFGLTGRLTLAAPTADAGQFAGDSAAVFAPSLAADYRLWRLFFGAEVGARLRPPVEFAGARLGTQLTASAGAGIDILDRELLSAMLEAHAYPSFVEQHKTRETVNGPQIEPNGTTIVPAEWMLSLRTSPLLGGDLSFFGGGGGPPPGSEAITNPRFRFVLGAVYAPTARDTDQDGIPDRVDLCPFQAGKRGGEKPGCPEQAP